MASHTEASFENRSSQAPRLPLIGHGCLISPQPVSKESTVREDIGSWAVEVRERLQKTLDAGKPPSLMDVAVLKQHLVITIITALQKDDRVSWISLEEMLMALTPFREYLKGKLEMHHYVARLLHHLNHNAGRLYNLHVAETLRLVFYKEVEEVLEGNFKDKLMYNNPQYLQTKAPSVQPPQLKPRPKYEEEKDIFMLDRPEPPAKVKGLSLWDLSQSLPNVAFEVATREAVWSHCLGTTALSLNTQIPLPSKQESPGATDQEQAARQSPTELTERSSTVSSARTAEPSTPTMTGRDAVEYFTRAYHTGKIKYMYFNVVHNRCYRPYDLIAVPKYKMEPEHYVFSTFGVLQVSADYPSESMSLAEWQCDAVLFNAISKMAFFKNYLYRKMFTRWRGNVHFAHFARLRYSVRSKLLHTVPPFGGALLQAAKLCKEVLALQFLPIDSKMCFKLIQLENFVRYRSVQATQLLDKFFSYQRQIVETTCKESFTKLEHCHKQVKHKAVFTRESLYLQRVNSEEREKHLREAIEETRRLGNLVQLLDQLLLGHLVMIARDSVTRFVYETMKTPPGSSREALFEVKLIFPESGMLTMSPPKEKFVSVLSFAFANIPTLLCDSVQPLKGRLPGSKVLEEEDIEGSLSSSRASHMSSRASNFSTRSRQHASHQSPSSASPPSRRTKRLADTVPEEREEGKMKDTPPTTSRLGYIHTPKPYSTEPLASATPDMVQERRGAHDLEVLGVGFMGQYNPINSTNLREKLDMDEEYQEAIMVHHELMEAAIEEVEDYCENNLWLNEINEYCNNWTEESVTQLEGAAAFTIEQKLNELRQWAERVRLFDHSYTTENCIFYVDCSGIHDSLIPTLDDICQQICRYVAVDAGDRSIRFQREMKVILENMKDKQTSMGGFAAYARNMNSYKSNIHNYHRTVDYIKSLFEVVRMSYRQLTPEEEALEASVLSSWDMFLFQLQDAMEFVNTQKPLITRNLDNKQQGEMPKTAVSSNQVAPPLSVLPEASVSVMDASQDVNKYLELEEEARDIHTMATSGKFLDPTQDATEILTELKELRERFRELTSQMQQASKWKEAITGEPYDLDFLKDMMTQMDLRQELWKYIEVSIHSIREWKTILFRKLQTKKIMDKLTEWQAAAGQMKAYFPNGDKLLAFWYRELQDFKNELPLLHKLAHDALKPRHWKAIFLSMGETYNRNHQFTVKELLSYNLRAHAQNINTIYAAALAEFAIERKLAKVRKQWNSQKFKLGQHIPDSLLKMDDSSTDKAGRNQKSVPSKKQTRIEKFRQQKAPLSKLQGLDLRDSDLYILVDVNKLQYQIEDSQVTLQMMLTSQYLADHRQEAESWTHSLTELKEVTELLHTCQINWLYLLKVFEVPAMYTRLPDQSRMFTELHSKFTEMMQVIAAEPGVMAVVSRRRTEKGYRSLQGDRMRNLLITLISSEEAILKDLAALMDSSRTEFPRLYFLSNQELVELLSISRNPQGFLPFAQRCFPGIVALNYALPLEMTHGTDNGGLLDFHLNGHQLEVTSMQSNMGEELPLVERLEAHADATKWLTNLEQLMRSSLQALIEECVIARFDGDHHQPLKLLEELAKFDEEPKSNEAMNLTMRIKASFSHWLMGFPSQCVLIAEAIVWERDTFLTLKNQDWTELGIQRNQLDMRIGEYVKVLRENIICYKMSALKERLHSLVGGLICQGLYHRDTMEKLLQNENLSDSAFDWLKVLRVHMDVGSILRAKPKPTMSPVDEHTEATTTSPMNPSLGVKVSHASLEDLEHGSTAVASEYDFGPCSISQMGATFTYNMEYMGPYTRLMFTPLTERAFLTLTIALKSFSCGSLIGPSGTGKSETIKDLAKVMGHHMVSISCCDDLKHPILNQFVNGMIQSGSWVLFDNIDRMSQGLLSVFGQHLEYIGSALRALCTIGDTKPGLSGADRKTDPKVGDTKIRRNSVTMMQQEQHSTSPLERQATVPHGFNESGLSTYFEDPWIKERDQRTAVEKEIPIKESEIYRSKHPPPLFYEHVTRHRQPRRDYKELDSTLTTYRKSHMGEIMFNGHLVHASPNFGCFMTMNTSNPASAHIPDNLRLCMRPCAMVVPDKRVIIELQLYSNGVSQHVALARKLCTFFDLLKTELPRRVQYNYGLRSMCAILKIATETLEERLNKAFRVQQRKGSASVSSTENSSTSSPGSSPSPVESSAHARTKLEKFDLDSPKVEEESIIDAIMAVLQPTLAEEADHNILQQMIRNIFPNNTRKKLEATKCNQVLMTAIEDQLRQDNLQASEDFVDKILELYHALQRKQGVILTGMTGSGKSTCYNVLAKVMISLHNRPQEQSPEEEGELVHDLSLKKAHQEQKLKILKNCTPRQGKTKKLLQRVWQRVESIHNAVNLFSENIVEEEDRPDCANINVDVVFPNVLPPSEMFGHFDCGVWRRGILAKIFSDAHNMVVAAEGVIKEATTKAGSRQAVELPSVIRKWLVLDGDLHPDWVDNMTSLLDRGQSLSLASGQQIQLHDSTSVIFELLDLTNASPSAITQCALVHCHTGSLSWKSLVESWMHMAKQRWVMTTASLQLISGLVSCTFTVTINFLTTKTTTSLHHGTGYIRPNQNTPNGIVEVMSFLSIFSALLEKHLQRDELEKKFLEKTPDQSDSSRSSTRNAARVLSAESSIPNYLVVIKHMFAFAYIWGFGGNLHDSCMDKFDKFTRDLLRRASQPITVPESDSVYDYGIDCKVGQFVKWSEKMNDRGRNNATTYIAVPELERYSYLVDLLVSRSQPVLIVGETGVGKSSFIQNLVYGKHPFTKLAMDPRFTTPMLYDTVMLHVNELKTRMADGTLQRGIPGGVAVRGREGRHLFFIDDLNAAQVDKKTGCQRPLELLRQMMTQKAVYNTQRQVLTSVEEAAFIAAATSTGTIGSGQGHMRHAFSERLTRLFTVLTMFVPSTAALSSLYTRRVLHWLEEFPTYTIDHLPEFAQALSETLVSVYVAVKERLRPTPSRPLYVFTLHNLVHVIDGVLLMSPRSKIKPKVKQNDNKTEDQFCERLVLPTTTNVMRVIVRLLCHECTRVFADRLVPQDVHWFDTLLVDSVKKHLCTARMPEKMISAMEYHRQPLSVTPFEQVKEQTGDFPLENNFCEDTPLEQPAAEPKPSETPSRPQSRSGKVVTPAGDARLPSLPLPPPVERMLNQQHITKNRLSLKPQSYSLSTPSHTTEGESGPQSSNDYSTTSSDTFSTSTSEDDSTDSKSRLKKKWKPMKKVQKRKKLTKIAPGRRRHQENCSSVTQGQPSDTDNNIKTKVLPANIDSSETPLKESGSLQPNMGSGINVRYTMSRSLARRGVSFRGDRDQEHYLSPLLSIDQICAEDERLTDMVFSKSILHVGSNACERSYSESSVHNLKDALETCLQLHNETGPCQLHLVFFEEAVRHIARLTRVLSGHCGNAILLGMQHCSGRHTLVKLASFITSCQLMEAKDHGSHDDNVGGLHRLLRRASRNAGISNKQTIVLVPDCLGEDLLMDICAVMKEGTCAGLYTSEMIHDIATQMTPGHVKLTRLEKVEIAFDKYLQKVRQNLHVIVCLDTSGVIGGDLRTTVSKLSPMFNQVCHVDLYRPWSHRAYRTFALHWLKQPQFETIPWNEDRKSEQMLLVANAMAYVHMSSMVMLQKQQIHEKSPRLFYTPSSFTELVHMFWVIGSQINDTETRKITHFESGLKLIHEAFDTIDQFKEQVSRMLPRHHQSLTNVAEKVTMVENLRQSYMQALDGCKKMETKIRRISEPLEQLRKHSELEFNKVNPSYHAALETLNALDPGSIDEIRSYRVPPPGINTVMNSLCLLFSVPQAWKSAKKLIIRDNFFQELAFYDKNNIPNPIFEHLGEICSKEDFTPQRLNTVSAAAAGLCQWVNAVHQYASVTRKLRSEMKELRKAEDELIKAQLHLGKQKVQADHIKTELESEIRAHKDCCTKAKFVEKQILMIERRVNRCENIMENMTPQETSWKQKLKTAKLHKKMIPSEALLAAASICYHGPLTNLARAELMNDWLESCKVRGFDLPPLRNQQMAPLMLVCESDYDVDLSLSDSCIPLSQQTSTEVVSKVICHDHLECVSSTQSLNPQMSAFRQHSSIYDIGATVTTELRIAASTDSAASTDDLDEVIAMETTDLLNVQDNFTLQSIMSTFDELSHWQLKGMPVDIHGVHNALIMRACCHDNQSFWPSLLDPNNMAEMWVRALQDSPLQYRYSVVRVPANYTGAKKLRDTIEEEDVTNSGSEGSVGTNDSPTEVTNNNVRRCSRDAKQKGVSNDTGSSSSPTNTVESAATCDLVPTMQADDVIERPTDNVWVVAADDPELGKRLINSVVHGVTLLVTHLERQPLSLQYTDIIQKKFFLDCSGERSVIVDNIHVSVHDGFALYLSMSVPISLQGDGIAELPFHQMYVIDLTMSQEATINHLLHYIMKIERPEFEGQQRSATNDIIRTQDEINRVEDGMLSKTLALDCPLLEEKMMLPSLIEYRKNISQSKLVFEESAYIGKLLDTKSEPYKMVAMQGTKLYEIVQRMSMLNPLYYMLFDDFSKIFMKAIETRNRGCRCTGDPKARSQELINAITSAINKYVCGLMFESHFKLFSLLTTLERLRLSQQLNNEELGLFVNGIDTSAVDEEIARQDKPDWLTDMEWLGGAVMESILPAFHGLRDSLVNHSLQWQEYFKCAVSLMMDPPGLTLHNLTAFQKCLLWKICQPQKLWEVSEALVLHELGGVIHPAHTFNIQHIYKQCDKSVPVIFMHPNSVHSDSQRNSAKGQVLLDPVYEVQDLAAEMGKEKGVRIVTCGVCTQSAEVQRALTDCMQKGNWLILQNMHLAHEWEPQILQMFKAIVLSGSGQRSSHGDDSSDRSSVSHDGSTISERSRERQSDAIHKDFRLWLTTRTDTGRFIPGILTQYSMKVSCEMTHNFKDTLQRTHDHTHKFFSSRNLSLKGINKLYGQSDSLVPLTVFHATLAQHCQLRQTTVHCSTHWTMSTQSVLLQQLNDIVNLCQQHKGVPEMAQVIYGGHCIDVKERDWVCAVADNVLLSPDKLTQLSVSPADVASLPQRMLVGLTVEKSFPEKLDDLVEVTESCMCREAAAPAMHQASRNLHEDLLHVIGMPSLVRPPPELVNNRAQAVLLQLQALLQDLPEIPRTNADGFYPMDRFLSSEVRTFQKVIDQLRKDVEFLLEVTKATIPPTTSVQQRLMTLSRGEIPDTWFARTVRSSQPVLQWVGEMKKRQEQLRAYVANVTGASFYDLAVFVRPDRFVKAVLQMYSRKQFKDLHTVVFTTELLPPKTTPDSPPLTGVYISGLHLHHAAWDADRGVLTKQQLFCERTQSTIPAVWLRPVDEQILAEERLRKMIEKTEERGNFSCPVFTTADTPSFGSNPVFHVSLPTEPTLWVEREVYLSTTP